MTDTDIEGDAAMKLDVTERAVACLKEEWGFEDGEFIRVYVRYAGGGSEPYALGILKERPGPDGAALRVEAGGMTFFIEERDQWYVEQRRLTIDAQGEELRFLVEE